MPRLVNLTDATGDFKVGRMPFGALCELMDAIRSSGVDLGQVFGGETELGDVIKALLLRAPALLTIALTGGPDGKSATRLSSDRLAEMSVNDTLTLLEAFLKENPVDELLGKVKNLLGLAARSMSAGPVQQDTPPAENGPGGDTSETS